MRGLGQAIARGAEIPKEMPLSKTRRRGLDARLDSVISDAVNVMRLGLRENAPKDRPRAPKGSSPSGKEEKR